MTKELSPKERLRLQREALKKGDIATVKKLSEEAAKELASKGFVEAAPLFRWIEKEWLEKGLRDGAIVEVGGKYYPCVETKEEDKVKEYRGRKAVTIKVTVNDSSKFEKFLEKYEAYKSKKSKSEYVVNLTFDGLVNDMEEKR